MTLETSRRAFAEELRAVAHLSSQPLVEAFARVPREHFLGPGPWQIGNPVSRERIYRTTDDDDPRHIYHDVLVALDPARELNNGQPSALARWIEALALVPGERVLHVGCGVGYYTAILAELVGPGGRVVGYEVDAGLAGKAQALLAGWPQVEVHAADGGEAVGTFDAMFINAGVTVPHAAWLDALAPGGRMIVPLTVHFPGVPGGVGGMVRIDRGTDGWPIRVVSSVGMYDCTSARDPAHEAELRALLQPGASAGLRVVERAPHERGPACLAHLPGFCLQR